MSTMSVTKVGTAVSYKFEPSVSRAQAEAMIESHKAREAGIAADAVEPPAQPPRIFNKGERVAIVNCDTRGSFFFEGMATVVKAAKAPDAQAEVRFEAGSGIYPRFIDPAAQGDPEAFVADLNLDAAAFWAAHELVCEVRP